MFVFVVIQHLILEGRTTDAIDKTKELFPILLNDKNLLFVLKVRQFIEMINGTESEIRHTPSNGSQSTTSLSLNNKSSSSSSRSRSNSPYTSTQQTNGTANVSARRSSANNNSELTQGIAKSSKNQNHSLSIETPCSSTVNPPMNQMDIDDNSATKNGFSNNGTVTSNGHTSTDSTNSNNLPVETNSNSNGTTKKSLDGLDGMEYDGITETSTTMKDEDRLLIRILQFGRELHALKQQLTIDYGENSQHDKMLQVNSSESFQSKDEFFFFSQDAFSLLAYSDPKTSPLASLLEPSQREAVSSAVNSAILGRFSSKKA